ncbi:MAG: hypothetical protein JNG88_01605 [Phycisphaerales bacterium]|nr:hypothetical protein [Phycisphaerales bacterium]
MWKRRWSLASVLILSASLCAARADRAVVELKDGRTLRGEVRLTADEVIIVTSMGEVRFARTEVVAVRAIEDDKDEKPAAAPQDQPKLGDEVAAEFRKRFAELAADDIEGHFRLAEWARDRNRYELVATQYRYILGMKPDHRNAKLLLQLAEDKLEQRKLRDGKPESRPAPLTSNKLASPPLLSDRDIQRLRIGELLSSDGQIERLRVSFNRKGGQRELVDEVIEELKTRTGVDPADLRVLEHGRAPDQLRVILKYTGMKHADRIEIEEDPQIFEEFRRDILPVLYNGCARSGCHGGEAAKVFRLPPRNAGRKDAATYTAFAILEALETRDGAPVINRRDPTASPLLEYLLPNTAESAHVNVRRFQPVAQSNRDRQYEMFLNWIRALKSPRPDYGLERKYAGYCPVMPVPRDEASTTQPADETMDEEEDPEKEPATQPTENPR